MDEESQGRGKKTKENWSVEQVNGTGRWPGFRSETDAEQAIGEKRFGKGIFVVRKLKDIKC